MKNGLHLALLPPAGSGSKGDEAMLRGVMALFQGAQIILLNPQERTWKDELLDIADSFTEKPYSRKLLEELVASGYDLIVLGADGVDGSVGLETSMLILNALDATINAGGFAAAFFSFRADPDEEIIQKIKSICAHPKLYFYLRDFASEQRFHSVIGPFNGGYFPDFSFYCPKTDTPPLEWLIQEPVADSDLASGFIALNYSEQSFRATRADYNEENRRKYIRAIGAPILSSYPGLPVILVSNDIRGWSNFLSDYEYTHLAREELKKLSPGTKVFTTDPAASFAELIYLLSRAHLLITGRMHLSIAALRAGIIPIIVTGKSYSSSADEKQRGMLDKAQGMLDRCIGCHELVITDPEQLYPLLAMTAERRTKLKSQLADKDLINRKEEITLGQTILRLLLDHRRNPEPKVTHHMTDLPVEKWVRREKIFLEAKIADLEKSLYKSHELAGYLNKQIDERETLTREREALLNKHIGEQKALIEERDVLIEKRDTLTREREAFLNKHIGEQEALINELNPTVINVMQQVRHQCILLADWLAGRFIKKTFKWLFYGNCWRLDGPAGPIAFSPLKVHISGTLRDRVGRPARHFFIRVGKRVILIKPPFGDGAAHSFDIHFNTRPGFKFVSLYAQFNNGLTLLLGYRLLYCRNPSALDNEASIVKLLPANIRPHDVKLKSVQTPLVSIIIPAYNQTLHTLQCLKSIGENSGDVSYEVIVIDDRSSEWKIRSLRKVRHLRVHRNNRNQGFVLNCNDGAKLAQGKYLIFLNNDTLVRPGWLQALLNVFELKPDAGLVGAKLIYPNGRLQEAGGIVWQTADAANYGNGGDPSAPMFNYLKEVDYCSGACLAIKARFFASLGGFDLRYAPAYYEDTDLAFRVREAGRKVYYQPRCEVIHYEGTSNGTIPGTTNIKRHQLINRDRFLDRWREVLNREHLPRWDQVFRARERSVGRPCLLVIDHYVPRFDRDAGSRNIFHYIKFFCDEGFRVKFMPDNLQREEPYVGVLEQLGVEVLGTPLEVWLGDNGAHLDYVLISRAHIAVKHLDSLDRHTRARRLFYGHDLQSRTQLRTYKITGNPSALAEARLWTQWENEVFARVDAVFYPSAEEIASLALTHPNLNAQALPLLTFPSRPEPAPTAETFAQKEGVLFVGGFGHPPNTDAMLWFSHEVLPLVRRGLPDLHVTIAGSHPPAEILSLASPTITVTGFISDEQLAALYSQARLVIAPLRIGGGIKGKILEAMWHRVPVVTTPVGAEGIPETESALVVAPPETYAVALESAYRDPTRLATLAAEGARVVSRYYSTDALRAALSQEIPSLRP